MAFDWMTDEQRECWDMLADIVGGHHHIGASPKESGPRGIEVNAPDSRWGTFDFNGLTRAVVLAHDRHIRFAIESSAPGRLRLYIHKRSGREGQMHQRHPTLDDAVKVVRNGGRFDQ